MISFLVSAFVLINLIFLLTLIFFAWFRGAPTVFTPQKAVKKMVKVAEINDGQIIYDLGSGDGRLLQEAARKRKALCIGYELFPLILIWSKLKTPFIKKRGRVKLIFGDFWTKNLNCANVIFCFLMPQFMNQLGNKFQKEAKTGAKLISYAFEIKNLKPKFVLKEKGIAPIFVYEKDMNNKNRIYQREGL